jgi:hypothetical protein
MDLTPDHIEALRRAAGLLLKSEFQPYLELKARLPDARLNAALRPEFRKNFCKYYGLNTAGLTDDFKDRYFEILFREDVVPDGLPGYGRLLDILSEIPRKKGDFALPFSFVSKLVAMQNENWPIYDRHVLNFFGTSAPNSRTPKVQRIAWFVGLMHQIATDYGAWCGNDEVQAVLNQLRQRDASLAHCAPIRLIDFLVWKVGNRKILNDVKRDRLEQSLIAELEAVPDIQQRIDLIAEDVSTGRERFRPVDVWKLAALLGLDFQDNADWDRSSWARKACLENDSFDHPYAENVELLEEAVPRQRYEQLQSLAEDILNGDGEDDDGDRDLPLTPEEIKLLEEEYSVARADDTPCFEYISTSLTSSNGESIYFAALVGDAGAIEDPESPYELDGGPCFEPEDCVEVY